MPRKINIGSKGGRYINYYGKKKYLSQFGGDKEEELNEDNREWERMQREYDADDLTCGCNISNLRMLIY